MKVQISPYLVTQIPNLMVAKFKVQSYTTLNFSFASVFVY